MSHAKVMQHACRIPPNGG